MELKDAVIEALHTVLDPELQLDIYSLGLIYNIDIADGTVSIRMTMTTPACPYGPALIDQTKSAVEKVAGVKEAKIEVVFDPPWQPPEDLRMMLGL